MLSVRAGAAPLVLLLALCGLAGSAWAQKTPPAPAAAPAAAPSDGAAVHVLVVDVQSLLQNSKAAKMVRQQIEKKRAEFAKEISHQEEALRKERDRLQREQPKLSAAALRKKGREFQEKVNDLDKSVQAKRHALESSNAEALQKIQKTMISIITAIAKKRKANMVFQRSELVLFDQSFDVTDEVLQKLDEQLPTVTVNFAAPAAAHASAPAHKKPAPKKK